MCLIRFDEMMSDGKVRFWIALLFILQRLCAFVAAPYLCLRVSRCVLYHRVFIE